MNTRRPSRSPGPLHRVLGPAVGLVLAGVLSFGAGPASAQSSARPILTREQEAQAKAEDAEREALIQRIYRERLLQVPSETFHPPVADVSRPVLSIVEDLLFLDLAARLLETGGAENVDRLREAAQAWRARATRDAARSRDALADRLRPTQDELTESGRTALPLTVVKSRDETKPAPDPAGLVAAEVPAAAPLDYIPVPPEDLAALRDRYLANGQRVDESWYARISRDPIAEQRWRDQQRAMEMNIARQQTGWATERGATFQFGEWLRDTWQRKDPFGLAIIAIFLLATGAVVFVAFKLLRRDR